MKYKRHPLNNFPDMDEVEFACLVKQLKDEPWIRARPVILWEDMILDGWQHYKAMIEAGFEDKVAFQELSGAPKKDPKAFAFYRNVPRRHLSKADKAISIAKHYCKMTNISNKNRSEELLPTLGQMAKEGDVSYDTLYQANKVVKSGLPEVLKAFDDKKISLKKAASIAAKPPRQQKKALDNALKPRKKRSKGRRGKPQAGPDRGDAYEPETVPPEVEGQVHDAFGKPVPDHLKDIFAPGLMQEVIERIDKTHTDLKRIAKSAVNRFVPWDNALDDLEASASLLEQNLPYAPCPCGRPKGCPDCKHHGWVPEYLYNQLKLEGVIK